MKTVLCFVACLFYFSGFAQTKLISFRSHSGSNAHFRQAVEYGLFDLNNSNFGLFPTYKIESVVLKSDDRIIVRTRKYYNAPDPRDHFFRDTLTKANASELFDATSMQALKAALKKRYKSTSLDSASFVGFNKKFKGK